MNKVILLARLTRDPEIRYSQGENSTCVARFSVAVNRRFKREGESDADFFNCIAFGKQAEFIEKYLRKGIKVVVTGRLQNNNYTNKEGQMVYAVQIAIEEIEFAESKSASGNVNSYSGNGGNSGGNGNYNPGNGGNPGGNGNYYPGNGGASGWNGDSYGSTNFNESFMNIPDGIDEELPFN